MSSDPPRKLLLLRHGKSAYPPGVPDHRRPLADRGRRQAGFAGEHIADLVRHIDLVLCSTAERARQTLAATGLAAAAPVEYRDEIYAAESEEILDLIVAIPDSVTTLLVIGHSPGIPELAERLATGSDPQALADVERAFPTSAFAVVSVHGGWSGLPASGRLVGLTVPRNHPESTEEKR